MDTDLKEPVEERCMIHPKELGLLQSMLTVDFWLLFFVCTVGARPARLCMHTMPHASSIGMKACSSLVLQAWAQA